ncbi:MAG: SprT family zinc-dependent metalloprotease [Pseudomonadota bacterium]
MSKLVLKGEPDIAVRMRRSAQCRRLSLRVSGLDGQITLTAPRYMPDRAVRAFLAEKETWLRSAVQRAPVPKLLSEGAELPVEGRLYRLRLGPVSAVMREDGLIILPARAANPLRALGVYLKNLARLRLVAATETYSAKIGYPFAAITLRDTRSRWGSCSSVGRLMYSWRLILAPPPVLRYVAAHEVAHLAEMNHGPAFWRLVEQICPDWQRHRDWLRENGARLHGYRFGD